MEIELKLKELRTLSRLVIYEQMSLEDKGKANTEKWRELDRLSLKICEAIDTLTLK